MQKIGIIGCGKIAQTRHIPEYLDNENAQIAGYFDLNRERAAGLAEQYGGKAYDSVEEMLKDPEIDAVSVCVVNTLHASVTIQALNAGKHVLCEKPMGTTLEECIAMVEAAKKNQKYLMIGQNQRLTKAHQKAKKLLEQGVIGDVITFKTCFGHGGPEGWSIDRSGSPWFFDKSKSAMGVLADLGIHKIDLVQFLLHRKIIETTCKLETLDKMDAQGNPISVDDNAYCIFKMDNGIIGALTASWTYYGEEQNSTVFYGTEGIMRIYEHPQFAITVIDRDGDHAYYDTEKIQTNDHQTKSGVIDAFIDALENDHEPVISGESVLPAMRAAFASIQSAKEDRTIRIPENELSGDVEEWFRRIHKDR
ncbi:MAG: Gfo/Idh/MocA family oxidoreductase [Parasporobacterium sp.]|nr:Gfo/Idh/MocA family oxidoreductase [Parasporobacterium sp.]